jgi:hypothetical protein
MKKRIALVAAALGAIFAFAGNAMAAPGSYTCTDNSRVGQTINSNVTVPAGNTCDLSWATINGNVSVSGFLKTAGVTTYNGNVTVQSGGHFKASNTVVTINGNLSFVNPDTGSDNGFWGDIRYDSSGNAVPARNVVTGNVTYTITSDQVYPQYNAPYLYFGGPTTINKNFTYSTGGRISYEPGSGGIYAPNTSNLIVVGSTSIS